MKPVQRLFRSLLRALLALFIMLNIILAFHAWKFTHFYDDPSLRQPQGQGSLSVAKFILVGNRIPKRLNDSVPAAPYSIVHFTTADGIRLSAWHLSCKDYLGDTAKQPAKGTVIIFHGHGSCSSALLHEANAFLRFGYNVLMTDFRAHGNSDGEQCMVGIKESDDVKAAYDYVKNAGEKNIVFYAVSMGAAAAAKAVNDYDLQPSKMIMEMPFATMLDATKGKLRIMGLPTQLAPILTFWGGTLNGRWAFSHKPYVYAEKITCPVLLQWGQQDPRVGEQETDKIFNHLASKEKKLVVYETAAHESLLDKEPEKWLEQVGAFVQ